MPWILAVVGPTPQHWIRPPLSVPPQVEPGQPFPIICCLSAPCPSLLEDPSHQWSRQSHLEMARRPWLRFSFAETPPRIGTDEEEESAGS